MADATNAMFDPAVFLALQQKIDEEAAVREALRDIVQTLEKQDRATQAILSRAHSTPMSRLGPVLDSAKISLATQVATLGQLAEKASGYPYYKYNGIWTRALQETTFTALLHHHLYTLSTTGSNILLPPTALATILNIPTASQLQPDQDIFHLTTEEYLHAVISLVDEVSRLARNAVTLGDRRIPVGIAGFVKEVHAGFQLLNLRNDALRRRGDGVKYRVKEVEDVVYDLSLRGLTAGSDSA